MGPVFLSGKKVDLRLFRKAGDFERCWKWINDPEVRRYLAAYLPITERQEEEWFTKERPNGLVLAIITKGEHPLHIGNIALDKINHREGTAETGTVIGAKEFWGKGYGTDAKFSLLRFAFDELNLRKIISHVLAFNKRSLAYARKCGYRPEAVFKKEKYRNGRYVDLVRLAVFRPDFERAWQRYQRDRSPRYY